MSNTLRVHGILLLVNLIYGANYTIAKVAMPDYIQPFGFILVRVVCAMVMFNLVHLVFIKEKVQKEDMPRLLACGIFGVAINQLMFFKGLNLTTPINAALMMITAPILVLLISTVIKAETLTIKKVAGICLGATGAFVIIYWGKHIAVNTSTFPGDIFVLINATSYAFYLVLVKPLMSKYHPFTIVKWIFSFGVIFVVPAGYHEFIDISWASFPLSIWLSVIYVVVGTTFLAYLLNVVALRKVNPSVVGTYIYLQPVIAGAIALAFGKDELNVFKIGAALLICSGVYLVSSGPKKIAE